MSGLSYAAVAAFTAAVVGLTIHGCEQGSRGALEQQIAAREKVVAVQAESLLAVTQRIPKVDTVAVRAVTVYRVKASDYRRIVDSTVAAMQAAGQTPPTPLIQACNAAVAAADSALSACARAAALRDTALGRARGVIAHQDTLLRLQDKRRPGRFGCAGPAAVSLKGVSLGVGCGVVVTF